MSARSSKLLYGKDLSLMASMTKSAATYASFPNKIKKISCCSQMENLECSSIKVFIKELIIHKLCVGKVFMKGPIIHKLCVGSL